MTAEPCVFLERALASSTHGRQMREGMKMSVGCEHRLKRSAFLSRVSNMHMSKYRLSKLLKRRVKPCNLERMDAIRNSPFSRQPGL